jgi:hypothetical protein
MRVAATASSESGSKIPKGLAREDGTPKSVMACREPLRSESLATPDRVKTAASSRRAIKRAESIISLLSPDS